MIGSITAGQDRWLQVAAAAAIILLAAIFGWLHSVTLLLALVGLGAVVVLLAVPDLGLSALVAAAYLVPLQIYASDAVALNAVVLFIPVLALFWLVVQIRRRSLVLRRSPTLNAWLIFVGAATASWVLGNIYWDPLFPQPANLLLVQLGQWAVFALSFLAFFLAAHQPVRALRWAVYAFIGLGVLALMGRSLAVVPGYYGLFAGRALSNGSFYIWQTALAGGLALFNRNLTGRQRLALMVVAVSVPVLGWLQDREWASSWLPALVVLAVLFWLLAWERNRTLAIVLLLPLPVAALLFWRHYALGVESISVDGRFYLWRSILDLAWRRPIFGLGLTTYRHYHHYIPMVTFGGPQWFKPNVNSHNMYIDIFAQMGVVGLLAFGWLAAAIARLGWRLNGSFEGSFRRAYAASALAGLIGMLFASAIVEWFLPFVYNTGFNGLRFSALAWMFLGGIVGLGKENLRP